MSSAQRWIIDTDVDAETTVRRMAKLCDRAMLDERVIHAANQIIADVPARDVGAQIDAIRAFMDSSFSFVPNPIGTQTIRPPGWTMKPLAPGMLEDVVNRGFTQGACDDAAVLIATIGMADGIPARFRALAFVCTADCGPIEAYTHVIADLLDDASGWVELDVTRPHDMDRLPDSAIAKTLVYNLS